jgi:hypothetical protein
MKCTMFGCGGQVPRNPKTYLKVGYCNVALASRCDKCGRLYWLINGKPVFDLQGHAAFLRDGIIINRDKDGREVSRT